MTYYGAKHIADSFRTVRKNTIQVAEDIPENKYDFRAAPDTRSVAQTLTHIACTPRLQLQIHQNKLDDLTKLDFPAFIQEMIAEEAKPRGKDEIIALLRTNGETFAVYLESLPESFLAEQVTMPPGLGPASKSRFEMLLGAKEHEMHHRGQLMVVQRMVGVVPHLTRQMQERMAQMQAGAPQAQAR
jgi:uncharacterized damage-inducible protein DinB